MGNVIKRFVDISVNIVRIIQTQSPRRTVLEIIAQFDEGIGVQA
jgi:hypothetical protein